jgi:hypothetical protein
VQETRNDINDIKFQFEKTALDNKFILEENDDLDIIIEADWKDNIILNVEEKNFL